MLDKTKGKPVAKLKLSAKDIEKKVKLAKKYKLSNDDLKSLLRNVFVSRKLDDAEISMKKQSKAFFQISGAGHEGVLSAAAMVLKPKHDWFIPYYRDRALCTGLGVTAYEMLCQANGNIGDTASHGRQMPAHWGNVKLNIVTKSSCTGTQFLQACGVAEAGLFLKKLEKEQKVDISNYAVNDQEIVYTSCGDGTTSQGEFWEAITTACVNKFPVLFHVEDNGYAISTPTWVQTPGGSISKAMDEFPGLKVIECDGNCPIESYEAFFEAAKHIRAGKGPALVHSHVTRPYSHSLSDDQGMYRTLEDLAEEKEVDVFNSYPKTLIAMKVMKEAEVKALLDEVSSEVREAMAKAIETPWPKPEQAMEHLYSEDVDITSSDFDVAGTFEGKDDVPMASTINAVLRSEFSKNPFPK